VRQEDVREAWAHEECRARSGGTMNACLHNRRAHAWARDRVWQRAEVREEQLVSQEVCTQGAKKAQQVHGDVFGRREARHEGGWLYIERNGI